MSELAADRWNLFRCEGCSHWFDRTNSIQLYCGPCRVVAQRRYDRAYKKRNRKLVDRTQKATCDCGQEYLPYPFPTGGKRVRCEECSRKRDYQRKKEWKDTPGGKASLSRQARRRKGEYVPDARLGPRT